MPTDPPLPAFDGWDTPHYTPIPDQLFDEWLPHLSEAELKVLLYIMRHTFGWKKDSDAISLRQMAEGILRRDGAQLDHGAGIALRSIQRALPTLQAKGLILAQRQSAPDGGAATTVYCPRMGCSQNDYTPSQKIQGGVAKMTTGGADNLATTRNNVQETDSQDDSNQPPPQKKQRPRQDATDTPASAAPPAGYSGPHSPYIAGVIFDHSSDLGDSAHRAANVTQALRLRQASGRDEAAFVALLHEARRLARTAQGKQGTGQIGNKMAYYFAVAPDLSNAPPSPLRTHRSTRCPHLTLPPPRPRPARPVGNRRSGPMRPWSKATCATAGVRSRRWPGLPADPLALTSTPPAPTVEPPAAPVSRRAPPAGIGDVGAKASGRTGAPLACRWSVRLLLLSPTADTITTELGKKS